MPRKILLERREFLRWAARIGGALWITPSLVGCGKSEKQSNQDDNQKYSDTLVMGSAVDLYTIDPAVGFDGAISGSLIALYDALFRYKGNPPEIIPWLADRYTVSEDATEWTFQLVKNARFHDGSSVTASSVKYSIERLLRIGEGASGFFAGILEAKQVDILDDYTIKMKLLKPYGMFLNVLPWLFIVNPAIVKEHTGVDDAKTWLKDHEAGSGPFTIGQWLPGEKYEFKAVKDYWKGWHSKKHINQYVRKVIGVNAQKMEALEKGEVHCVDWATPAEQIRFKNKGFIIPEVPSMKIYEIKLNNQNGFTADKNVRKALSYAFDYKALIGIWEGTAVRAKGPLPHTMELTDTDLALYEHNIEKAREMLAQSPWPDGNFSLDYVYVRGLEEERKTGEILRESLAKLAIKVNIIPMAWADAVSSFTHPGTSPSIFPLYSATAYYSPDNYLWSGYHSSNAGMWTNPGHYKSKEMDQLLESARSEIDYQKRNKLYFGAQQRALNDAVNIFGISVLDDHIYNAAVKGVDFCPILGYAEDIYWLWFS